MIRFFDFILSLAGLAILSPLLLVVIVVLKCTGEGEVFFFQSRSGLFGRQIRVVKFATMLKNSPNIGTQTVTVKDDPRVLPVGKILRKTKLNEVPQLWNVVKGEMSLIGPRPQASQNFSMFSEQSQEAIRQLKPGLSGVGSLVFRNEEEILENHNESFYMDVVMPYKGELEEWFYGNESTRLYFYLIALTIWQIVFPKSRLVWSALPGLPRPPEPLRAKMQGS